MTKGNFFCLELGGLCCCCRILLVVRFNEKSVPCCLLLVVLIMTWQLACCDNLPQLSGRFLTLGSFFVSCCCCCWCLFGLFIRCSLTRLFISFAFGLSVALSIVPIEFFRPSVWYGRRMWTRSSDEGVSTAEIFASFLPLKQKKKRKFF